MRAAKSLVGWLCVLSLLAGAGFLIYSEYIPSIPFRNGATAYRLPDPDTAAIARMLGNGGIDGSDMEALQKVVAQEVEPQTVFRGSQAAREIAQDSDYKPTSNRHNIAAAALLDANGRVIAACPKDLVGQTFPFGEPISRIRESMERNRYGSYDWSSVSSIYPYWTSTFRNAVRAHRDMNDVEDIMLQQVRNQHGDTIAILAVAVRNLKGINLPPGAALANWERTAMFQQLAIAMFIVYLILLPIWVGMDAHWRGMRPFAWASLVAITNVIGLAAYLVARLPGPYPCTNCGEEVLGKYVRCPACGVSLMNRCPICHTRMKPNWQYCPVCNVTPTHVLETVPPKDSAEPLATRLMENTRANLHVTVLDAEAGAPMPNARVSVVGRASRVDGMTNTAGIFEARKLRGGRYTITTTKAGYESAEAELDINEAPESVQLNLRAMPAKIIGRVIERGTTRPVAGVTVYVDSSRVDRSTLTGGEGGFVLDDIPAGPYTVAVDAVGFKQQTRLAEVAPGQQVTLDFSIEPADSLV